MESREELSKQTVEQTQDIALNAEPALETGDAAVNETEPQPVEPDQSSVAGIVLPDEPSLPELTETSQPESTPEVAAACDETTQPGELGDKTAVSEVFIDYSAMDKSQLVDALEQVVEKPIETIKGEIAAIKAAFFALRKQELSAEKEEFLAKGNEESAFAPREDEHESKLKSLLEIVKQKRAEHHAAQEAIREQNLARKREIINQIEEITGDPDNINRQFPRVQQLQQDFKAVGPVPATDETEVWKAYQLAVERFYDLLKINKELRDYDFKKNLELKQELCSAAEALDDESDVVDAFRKLQELHNKWREIGPVAKELREQLWDRFKNASAVINKKHQAFFEQRKSQEAEMAEAKTALCEEIEKIDPSQITTYSGWDEATKVIIDLQARWKSLGFASRKLNAQLFMRFRKSCDDFFAQKAEFYKKTKEQFAANLEKKLQLCERAEALKDSTDWRATTDQLVALQKEWKTIGPVAKRHSDEVWKRFVTACDHFFEQKKAQFRDTRSVERDNLKIKREIIAAINQALDNEDATQAEQIVREQMAKWGTVGHVPFRDKDKVYDDYRTAVDKAYEKLDMKGTRAHLANFESSLSQLDGTGQVQHERERLVRAYEQKCSELKTFENNMGFFNARSQTGSSLVKEMERRIERIKEDIALLKQKIKMIDDK